MSKWIRSNVLGLVAIFIALGGTAFAASVAKNSVTSKSIKTGAVKSADIGDGQVTGTDVQADGLTGADIAEGALGKVPSATSADSAAPSGPASGDLTGTFPGPSIAPGAVSGSKVADGSLTGADIEDFSLSSDEIGDPGGLFGCQDGAVNGWAKVDGDSGFSATFAPVAGYNCNFPDGPTAGVEARRNSIGSYCLRFTDLGAFLAVGSAAVPGDVMTVQPGDGAVCPSNSYRVEVAEFNGSFVDATFYVIAAA